MLRSLPRSVLRLTSPLATSSKIGPQFRPQFRSQFPPRRKLTTEKKSPPKDKEPKMEDAYGASGSVSTEVLTPGEKVVNAGWNLWYLGLFGLAVTCGGYIFMELNPFGSSPQSVMNAR